MGQVYLPLSEYCERVDDAPNRQDDDFNEKCWNNWQSAEDSLKTSSSPTIWGGSPSPLCSSYPLYNTIVDFVSADADRMAAKTASKKRLGVLYRRSSETSNRDWIPRGRDGYLRSLPRLLWGEASAAGDLAAMAAKGDVEEETEAAAKTEAIDPTLTLLIFWSFSLNWIPKVGLTADECWKSIMLKISFFVGVPLVSLCSTCQREKV
jgi:hypothetical protein